MKEKKKGFWNGLYNIFSGVGRIWRKMCWRIGCYWLRRAGLRIPETSFKNQLIPVEIEAGFNFPIAGDAVTAKKQLKSAEDSILNQCRPYIHVQHTAGEDDYHVRLKLIIQRYERV